MKVDAAWIQMIARRWPDDLRFVLLHGQDGAASRDYADQIVRQFADPANPMAVEILTGAAVGGDPQALVAAAGNVSMFGDRTLVRVDGIDDDGHVALAALLASPPGNPVVAVAGALKKGSALSALADSAAGVAALISYDPGRATRRGWSATSPRPMACAPAATPPRYCSRPPPATAP